MCREGDRVAVPCPRHPRLAKAFSPLFSFFRSRTTYLLHHHHTVHTLSTCLHCLPSRLSLSRPHTPLLLYWRSSFHPLHCTVISRYEYAWGRAPSVHCSALKTSCVISVDWTSTESLYLHGHCPANLHVKREAHPRAERPGRATHCTLTTDPHHDVPPVPSLHWVAILR